jgi:hypothetical protein
MTFQTAYLKGPRASRRTKGDRSVALIVSLLLGLVFAPIIFLHLGYEAARPGEQRPPAASHAHAPSPAR